MTDNEKIARCKKRGIKLTRSQRKTFFEKVIKLPKDTWIFIGATLFVFAENSALCFSHT